MTQQETISVRNWTIAIGIGAGIVVLFIILGLLQQYIWPEIYESPELRYERIKPIGQVNTANAEMVAQTAVAEEKASEPKSPEEIYNTVCTVCHGAGVLNAPKYGNKADWIDRLAKGEETLINNAINGLNNMPARGGDTTLSDEEVKQVVQYLLASIEEETATSQDTSSEESQSSSPENETTPPEEPATPAADQQSANETAPPAEESTVSANEQSALVTMTEKKTVAETTENQTTTSSPKKKTDEADLTQSTASKEKEEAVVVQASTSVEEKVVSSEETKAVPEPANNEVASVNEPEAASQTPPIEEKSNQEMTESSAILPEQTVPVSQSEPVTVAEVSPPIEETVSQSSTPPVVDESQEIAKPVEPNGGIGASNEGDAQKTATVSEPTAVESHPESETTTEKPQFEEIAPESSLPIEESTTSESNSIMPSVVEESQETAPESSSSHVENTATPEKSSEPMVEESQETTPESSPSRAEKSIALESSTPKAEESQEKTVAISESVETKVDSEQTATKAETTTSPESTAFEAKETTINDDSMATEVVAEEMVQTPDLTKFDLKKGEQVYKKVCFNCHAQGLVGSPKLGDKPNWLPRIAKGIDVLVKNAIEGFKGETGFMPPKGGQMQVPNEDIEAAVAYMISQVP